MAEILVEENFARIDGSDMNVILNLLDEVMTIEAEPTAPRRNSDSHRWELSIHWLQAGPMAEDVEAALPHAVTKIRNHFEAAGKLPPWRIALYRSDGQVLRDFPSDAA